MPTERTEFQFDERGGQHVLRRLDQIARSADSASAAFKRMNSASVAGTGVRSESQTVRLELANLRLKTQELKTQAAAQKAAAEAARQASRASVADIARTTQLARQRVAEARAAAQQDAAAARVMVAEEARKQESIRQTGLTDRRVAEAMIAAERREQEAIRQTTALEVARQRVLRQQIVSAGRTASGQFSVQAAGIRANTAGDYLRATQVRQETALIKGLSSAYQRFGLLGALAYRQLQGGNTAAAVGLNLTRRAAQAAGATIQAAFRGATSAVRGTVSALTAIPRALLSTITSPLGFIAGGAGAFFAGRSLVNASDTYLNVANRIAATNDEAARSTKLLARTQAELFDIASRSRVPIEDLAELYGRLSLGAQGASVTQQDLLTITETVGKATAIGGGSASSIQGALIQLSQIFGAGGRARGIGQELRSLREQAPYLFVIMAEGLKRTGVTASGTTAELERLAEQGELTSDQVAKALLVMSEDVEARFKRITPAISQSLTVLHNSWVRFVGTISARTGGGKALADTILSIAETLDRSAEKFAERINTVLETVRRVYFMDLSPQDSAKAKEQLDRITESLTSSLGLTLDTLARSLFDIVETAARIFADAISGGVRRGLGRVLYDLAQQPPLSLLAKDGASGKPGFGLLASEDQLAKLTEDLNRTRAQIINEGSSGGVSVYTIQKQSEIQGAIVQTKGRIADLKAEQLDAAEASRELGERLKQNANDLKDGVAEAWTPFTATVDRVSEEQRVHITLVDRLKTVYKELTGGVVDFANGLRQAHELHETQLRTASEYLKSFEESENARRLAARGFDSDAATDNVENLLKKQKDGIKKALEDANLGIGGELFDQTLAQMENIRLETLKLEAQRKAFDAEDRIIRRAATAGENEYRAAIELTNAKRELGILSTVEAQRAALEATKQHRYELQGTLQDYEALAATPFLQDGGPLAEQVKDKIVELRFETEKLRLEIEAMNPDNFWGGFSQGVSRGTESMTTLRQAGEQTGSILADALGNRAFNALESITQGTESAGQAFRNMAASILSDLARMIWQLTVFNSLQGAITGAQNGGGLSGFVGGLFSSPFAHGAAFSGGRVYPFAHGGAFSGGYMVDRPTIFPMARGMGLMGEAGPEAVVPLERDSRGNLGVNATGGGRSQTVVLPVLVRDSHEVERMVAAHEHEDATLRAIRRNPAAYRAAMGVRG